MVRTTKNKTKKKKRIITPQIRPASDTCSCSLNAATGLLLLSVFGSSCFLHPSPAGVPGDPANMRDGVQLAVKLLGNVPPPPPKCTLRSTWPTAPTLPGGIKSRRPRREKVVCQSIRTPPWLRPLLVFFTIEGGGRGFRRSRVHAWPTDPEGLMVPFSASVTGLWNYKSRRRRGGGGVGEECHVANTVVRVP